MLVAVVGQEGLLGAAVALLIFIVAAQLRAVSICTAATQGLGGCTEEALVIVMLGQFQNQTVVAVQSA
jgi:hypothetical protein